MPDFTLRSLQRIAAPLAFGGNGAQEPVFFAELHRVGVITQLLGICAYCTTWLLMPQPNWLDPWQAILALGCMLASFVVRVRCRTLLWLTISGACAVLALTFGLRTMADAVGNPVFWVLPVGVFMTLAIAPIFNGGLTYLAVVAGIWWIVWNGVYQADQWVREASWMPLMMVVTILFGLALNVSFSLLRLRNFHARQELTRLAFQDSLTGLNNRRMFTQSAQRMQREEPGRVLYFMMIDLDNFKKINDGLGHDVGDEVLVKTAAIIAASANGHLCGRLGGEEFGVVFVGDREAVCLFAAALVDTVYRSFALAHVVSISVGIAELACDKDLGHSYRLADESLYQAKRQGKNCYVIA